MSHSITGIIYDLATGDSSDISSILYEKSMQVRHNLPRQFTCTVPSGSSLLSDTFGDGFPACESGDRKLIVWQDGGPGDQPIFHGRIWTVERTGDGTQNLTQITAIDSWMELGFDADDRAGRPVRDETGNFISPSFNSGGTATADDLAYQILTNSQQTGSESDPNPGEGPLPIDIDSGTFSGSIDLNPLDSMDWPVFIGDFFTQLCQTGVVDMYFRPVDPSEGFDAYVMTALSVVESYGSDVSGTVHFDYFTGSKNAGACRFVDDFTTVCNKLYDYLGPRLNQNQWKANITPGTSGTTIDPTASRARYGGPDGGSFMQIREFDSIGTESSSRPLYIAAWNAEQGYRIVPRLALFITPVADDGALFLPFTDYDVGDTVAVNTGADFGVSLAETQRVLGFDVTWSRENEQRVSQLLTTADVDLG